MRRDFYHVWTISGSHFISAYAQPIHLRVCVISCEQLAKLRSSEAISSSESLRCLQLNLRLVESQLLLRQRRGAAMLAKIYPMKLMHAPTASNTAATSLRIASSEIPQLDEPGSWPVAKCTSFNAAMGHMVHLMSLLAAVASNRIPLLVDTMSQQQQQKQQRHRQQLQQQQQQHQQYNSSRMLAMDFIDAGLDVMSRRHSSPATTTAPGTTSTVHGGAGGLHFCGSRSSVSGLRLYVAENAIKDTSRDFPELRSLADLTRKSTTPTTSADPMLEFSCDETQMRELRKALHLLKRAAGLFCAAQVSCCDSTCLVYVCVCVSFRVFILDKEAKAKEPNANVHDDVCDVLVCACMYAHVTWL